ncbi:MAG: prolyl oligopeptidase family serine peptidase [Asticcacaulis sp.]
MSRVLTAIASILLLTATQAAAQTSSSDVTQVVVKGAARPKPAEGASPPPIELFVKAPRVEQVALSPDGSRLAFVSRKAGLRLLTVYNVTDGSNQTIRLSEDPLTALTFLDNDHIVLSETETGLRGTCPSGTGHTLKAAQTQSDLSSAMTVSGFNGGGTDVTDADPILSLILQSTLTPPPCVSYGVRAEEAATIVDLRTTRSVSLGNRMAGDYDHMPLGLPNTIMADGKLRLVGPFLELRDKSIGGQLAQRVYLWRLDPETGRGRIVDDHGGDLDRDGSYVDDWLTDDKGEPKVRSLYTYITETFTIEMRKDGKWTPLLKRKIGAGPKGFAPFIAGWGRDGQSVLIIDAATGASGERRFRYYELAADGKLSEPLDDDATRDRPLFDPETHTLSGFARNGESTTYSFFDPGLAEYYKHALDTEPGQSVDVAATGRDPAQMILFAQGGDDPGSWHYFDFTNGKRVDLGGQYPSVPTEWVASQRSVSYKAADGMELHALVTLPSQGEARNRALVVLPHDGPFGHDAPGYDWLAQVLASRGYVVLQPNYRGSDGDDPALTEAGYGQWSGRMLSDVADGVRYLTAQGIADARRVCIAGRGFGGYAALAGAQGGNGLYRCAAAIGGIVNPANYLETAKFNAVADDIAPLRADVRQPRAFRADPASPALIQRYFGGAAPQPIAAASIGVPVLLVQGDHDRSVPVQQGRGLRDGLQKAGKAVTYAELQDCGHELATETCRLGAAQAVVDFLAKYNPAR